MRVKISFSGRGRVGFNYNTSLAGVLYRAFQRADEELSSSIHSSREIKLFTFSELKGGKPTKEGIFFSHGGYFLVSSPREKILKAGVEGLLDGTPLEIGGLKLTLESMEVLRPPRFSTRLKFRTLSPIKTSTMVEGEKGPRQWDLSPSEGRFYENLIKNLVKKYRLFHHKSPSNGSLEFSPPTFTKQRRIRIKNTYHRCYMMDFSAEGPKDLLKMGYEAGFGEKNSMGFGMVKVA